MKSIIVTTSVVLLAVVCAASIFLAFGAGLGENIGAMWFLYGVGAVAFIAAALLTRNPHSRIKLSRGTRDR